MYAKKGNYNEESADNDDISYSAYYSDSKDRLIMKDDKISNQIIHEESNRNLWS